MSGPPSPGMRSMPDDPEDTSLDHDDPPSYDADAHDTSLLSSYNPFAEDEKEPLPYGDPPENNATGITVGEANVTGHETRPKQSARVSTHGTHAKSRRQYSVRKPGRQKSGHIYYKQATRALRPTIFVNTNLARHQRKISNNQHEVQKLRAGPHQDELDYGRFVSLEHIKAVDAAALTGAHGNGGLGYILPQLNASTAGAASQASEQGDRIQQSQLLANAGHGPQQSSSYNLVVFNGDELGLGGHHVEGKQRGSTTEPNSNRHARPRANTAQSLSPYKPPGNPHGAANPLRGSLSPYDRAILIGLSLGHEDTEADIHKQQLSPNTVIEDTEVVKESPDHQPVLTPTILITPAKEFPPALSPNVLRRLKGRLPVASSVYSRRVSEWLDGAVAASSPVAPPGEGSGLGSPHAWRASTALNVKRESVGTVFEEDDVPLDRTLRRSGQTDFEEEESPMRGHLSPDEAGRKNFNGPPLPVESPRHPSAGWWNIITTPFLTRSNTNASNWPTDDQDRPELPDLGLAAAIAHKYEQESGTQQLDPFSPLTPPSAKPDNARITAWADFTRWEEEMKAADAHTASQPPPSMEKESEILAGFSSPKHGAATATDSGASAPNAARHQAHNGSTPAEQWPLPAGPSKFNPLPASRLEQSPIQDAAVSSQPYATLSPNDREVPVIFNGHSQRSVGRDGEKADGSGMDLDARLAQRPGVPRTDTYATEVDEYRSPTVHQANVAAVVRAGIPVNTAPSASQERLRAGSLARIERPLPACDPPPYSPPRARLPPERSAQVLPSSLSAGIPSGQTPRSFQHPAVPSHQVAAPGPGPAPWSSMAPSPPQASAPSRDDASGLPPRPNMLPVTMRDLESRAVSRRAVEDRRRRGDKEDTFARKVGAVLRRIGFSKLNGCLGRSGSQARKRRRWCCGVITAIIVALILIVVLAVTLSRRNRGSTSQDSRWVNITGWPPMPTGVYAVVRPDLETANSGCVSPSTLWSCALPKDLQQPGSASTASEPTFLFKIDFLQANAPNATTLRRRSSREGIHPRAITNEKRAETTNLTSTVSFSAFPDPPSIEDQRFLGNTTDGIVSALKEGEGSPFALTLLSDSTQTSSRLRRRQDEPGSESDESEDFPDIGASIPPPDSNADGTAKAANLLPLAASQQLRLYDRGLDSEHVGFYIYFDRSIFQSASLAEQSDLDRGEVPDDRNGGSARDGARARCTWTQTRFLIQIWTRRDGRTRVARNNATSSTATVAPTVDNFPYPVTITSDRHGGDVTKKMIYCYGINARSRLVPEEVKIQLENRGFGGQLVGGGQGPLGKDRVTVGQGGLGGIDGGTGGCACRWDNFAQVI